MLEDEVYQVVKTCRYTSWAFREIVCDHNYMEASDCSKTFRGHVPIYMISGTIAHKSIKANRGAGEVRDGLSLTRRVSFLGVGEEGGCR